jgi:hypothetical protein
MKTLYLDFDARPNIDFSKLIKPYFICCCCGRAYNGKAKFYLLFRKEDNYKTIENQDILGLFPFMISKESINEIPKEERNFLEIGSSCVKKIPKEFVFTMEEL